MNCNPQPLLIKHLQYYVSIPNRDFDELQFNALVSPDAKCKVSIPNRDFDELQYNGSDRRLQDAQVSIPNRDFDELQFSVCSCGSTSGARFQSLIGILMNCNPGTDDSMCMEFQFQSLIGILMNCNSMENLSSVNKRSVSIPNRDFDELQYESQWCTGTKAHVSIPNRDFDELQYNILVYIQLLGQVSIPNRDFDELQ